MIEKLKNKIFLIIAISLTIVVFGTLVLFGILNYINTIDSAIEAIGRFDNDAIRKNFANEQFESEIKGLYYILIENSKMYVMSDNSYDDNIGQYAWEINNGHKEKGIIDKYVYKLVPINSNNSIIILMEDESVVSRIKTILYSSIIAFILSEIAIYIIAKKISSVIVKPVRETFEKQKQFISDASHELKTPLAVIEANTDVLEEKTGNNKWISYIQNEIESMNKLINELLFLAKMENKENTKEYERLDLSNEVEIITSMFESMAYENNIKIKSNIQENITINMEKEDIKHILSTLLDNAIKHTDFEKEIIVELKKEKNDIVLLVENTGNPIPEEESEKIFERFYRIDKSRNRSEKRYGLGLAIAKSTVQKYNGNIKTYRKNNYTVFEVKIPN